MNFNFGKTDEREITGRDEFRFLNKNKKLPDIIIYGATMTGKSWALKQINSHGLNIQTSFMQFSKENIERNYKNILFINWYCSNEQHLENINKRYKKEITNEKIERWFKDNLSRQKHADRLGFKRVNNVNDLQLLIDKYSNIYKSH